MNNDAWPPNSSLSLSLSLSLSPLYLEIATVMDKWVNDRPLSWSKTHVTSNSKRTPNLSIASSNSVLVIGEGFSFRIRYRLSPGNLVQFVLSQFQQQRVDGT